jgi:hypothetical protein
MLRVEDEIVGLGAGRSKDGRTERLHTCGRHHLGNTTPKVDQPHIAKRPPNNPIFATLVLLPSLAFYRSRDVAVWHDEGD